MANHGFPEVAPLEDTCLLLLRFESGASGSLEFTWLAQPERAHAEFIILGAKGTIEFDTFSRQFFVTRDKRRAEEFEIQPSRGFVEQMCSIRAILAAYRSAESGHMVLVKDVED